MRIKKSPFSQLKSWNKVKTSPFSQKKNFQKMTYKTRKKEQHGENQAQGKLEKHRAFYE